MFLNAGLEPTGIKVAQCFQRLPELERAGMGQECAFLTSVLSDFEVHKKLRFTCGLINKNQAIATFTIKRINFNQIYIMCNIR